MSTKDKSTGSITFDLEELLAMGAGSGSGGSGNNGNGVGGGGGSPGGDKPGGGNGNGGGPPSEHVGNNLSFPAIFLDTAPALRGDPDSFTFTTPTYLTDHPGYVYFAQGVAENTWQAGSVVASGPIAVDHVDIGDALESAPIKGGTNVRLELAMYEELDSPMTAFSMELLGGAKGSGKPTVKGPTESQGAQLSEDLWQGNAYTGSTADAPDGTTYASDFASIYGAAAAATEGETVDSYMRMSIQEITGLGDDVPTDEAIAGLEWDGYQWVDANTSDGVTVGANIMNTAFGPELNIAGKYIMGASGKPFKFTSDGDYLITFAVDDGTPISFDQFTTVSNDGSPEIPGFQPVAAVGRETVVVADGEMSYGEPGQGPPADTHNGLLVMLVGVPSSVDEGGGDA